MKIKQWNVQRQLIESSCGWQRWDSLYQTILKWQPTDVTKPSQINEDASATKLLPESEEAHARSLLCEGIYPTTNPNSDY